MAFLNNKTLYSSIFLCAAMFSSFGAVEFKPLEARYAHESLTANDIAYMKQLYQQGFKLYFYGDDEDDVTDAHKIFSYIMVYKKGKALSKEVASAAFYLGCMYNQGNGVEEDIFSAMQYFSIAIDKDNNTNSLSFIDSLLVYRSRFLP